MRTSVWLSVGLAAAFAIGAGACRKYVTYPIARRPEISSIIAFPQVLHPGDSTIVTVFATDPDGDSLVYDWFGSNGLYPKDDHWGYGYVYNTHVRSEVFYSSSLVPGSVDTAFVSCSVRDSRGGDASRFILIFYEH